MSKSNKPTPRLVFADDQGQIYDHPDLLMLCRKGEEFGPPRPDELMPLPEESEVFLLPGRRAVGLDPETGQAEALEENAVAAFVSPGYTLGGVAAYAPMPDAPVLPLFAYAAVGYARDRFWVPAKRVDRDMRQVFSRIPRDRVEKGARKMMRDLKGNRLARHLSVCALTYGCPAAKNLALGRFEAPLPTARTCNARCLGCISLQPEDSPFPATQERIAFAPDPREIADVMAYHASREKRPILSFGQGCEGEPLTEAEAIAEGVALYRRKGGAGTVNVNTNASLPETMEPLARAGVNSIRASLNSVRQGPYEAYYRPKGYGFSDVVETIRAAKEAGLFVSLNLLFHPGFTDTEEETQALEAFVAEYPVDFIQLRNLNMDPDLYLDCVTPWTGGPSMGLSNFMKRLKKSRDMLAFGYFNPYLDNN